MEATATRNFTRTILPWLAAAIMLLLYLVTLNKVVTIQSVWPLARASGLDWHATLASPLTYLVTLPIRWLPSGVQLLALNFTAALCAALSLALLARSVAILPHDRTQLQRERALDENAFLKIRLAWVPVALAVAVLGLQRSFWEHAIVGTGEALDLLIFAYCVRCLLEYRIDEQDSWLYKLAVVYGIGITNNFAMIGFLPVLFIALVWIKGWRFFRFDFLVKMFLLALAGLSLYLLLPLVGERGDITFWQALKTNLVWQKHYLLDYRTVALIPAIYAFVPLLLMGIKWSGNFGDQSPIGALFAKVAVIILHAGLLVLWLYVAFDPPVSPREIAADARETHGVSFVFLPCYFLGALMVGYYSGFLLLVFSGTKGRSRWREVIPPALNLPVTVLVCGGALFVAGKLLYDNFPQIQKSNSPLLRTYVEAQIKSLPEKAVVLSDDAMQLHVMAALLGRAATEKYILLESRFLTEPVYYRFLRKRYGDRFPDEKVEPGDVALMPLQVVDALYKLGQTNEIFYLQPSFGYFFESFYLEPRDLLYALKPYPTNATEVPVPDAAIIGRQQNFWKSPLAGPLNELKSRVAALPTESRARYKFTEAYVGQLYSRSLDFWGVELQRAKRFDDAFPLFEDAVALNPDNVAALINRDLNAMWRKEKKSLSTLSAEHLEKLKLFPRMQALLMSCGPLDDPYFSGEFANYFAQLGLYRQAQQAVLRGLSYAPEDGSLLVALANVYLLDGEPDRALNLLAKTPAPASNDHIALAERARISALAYYEKKDFSKAKEILETALRNYPELETTHNALAQLHLTQAERLRKSDREPEAQVELTNALRIVEAQLKLQPNNLTAEFNHGNCCIFVGDYDCAIKSFTRVLEQQKDNGGALLNRAIANFQASRKAAAAANTQAAARYQTAAKRDYREVLERFTTTNYQVYYGLAEIAREEKDWGAAREYYEKYLRYAPSHLGERAQILARLEEVKGK